MHFLLKNFPDPIASGATAWLAYHEAQADHQNEADQLLHRLKNGTMNEREKQAFIHLINGKLAKVEKKFEVAIENFQEASELVTHVVHPPPHFYHPVLAYSVLAEVYEKNNQLDSAIEVWKKIIAHKIQSFLTSFTIGTFAWVEAHYHLGRLYQEKGDQKLAIEYYRKFLDLWKNADKILPEIKDAKEKLNQLSNKE